MTALSSYSTGTVSVTADGTTVTGTSTLWSSAGNVKPGDIFQSGHFEATITDVTDDTHLVITPWPGSTLSVADYVVWKVSQQRIVGATYAQSVSDLVAALNSDGFFFFVDVDETEPDPSLGDDGQYAFQPTTGKTWVKSAGAWSYLGIYKGFQFEGAWDSGTDYTVGDVVTLSGSSYVCVLDHTNHTPPNATYWQLLASKGDAGSNGAAATVAVGTTTTGAGGSSASVTNSGSSSAAVFDFTIPASKSYGGTSTTSLTIGTGSKAFTTQAGLAYQDGARVRATATAGATGWLEGVVMYSGTTLTITSDKISGSGTGTAWNFNVVGEPGGAITTFSATLGADVALSSTGVYQDGPSVNAGASGTFFVSGTVTFRDTAQGAPFAAKLWDGTTVIASTTFNTGGAGFRGSVSLSGFITNPAGNLRISVADNAGSPSGQIMFNNSGLSKDCVISAMKIP